MSKALYSSLHHFFSVHPSQYSTPYQDFYTFLQF